MKSTYTVFAVLVTVANSLAFAATPKVFYGVSVDEGPLATADRVLAVGSQSCTISVRVCAKRLALSIRPRCSKRLVRQRVWVHN